jgi:hypothetical protein
MTVQQSHQPDAEYAWRVFHFDALSRAGYGRRSVSNRNK